MNFAIHTLGCKVNLYESEAITELLENNNYKLVDFDKDLADIYIINTCTVTNSSDQKSRQMIRKAKRKNPDAIIVAMGCFVQSSFPSILDEVDINIGSSRKMEVLDLLNKYKKNHKKINAVDKIVSDKFEDMRLDRLHEHTRAFIKIQDGCEAYCSYCIIPRTRGKVKSKAFDQVINEIKDLVKNNYKEVVLTGIHTGQYGKDINTKFSTLLEKIAQIDGLKRIRISSIEVNELDDEVLDLIKKYDNIVSHFHIPLQSGSNKVLKLMNRKYLREDYIEKIKEIRKIRKDPFLAADVIVGHPGEDEDAFMDTYNLLKDLEFAKIHVFPYSKRKNTKSSVLKQVDGNIKKERGKRLIELSKELEINYMKKYLDREVEVLIERNKGNFSYGHTDNFLNIRIRGSLIPNKFYKVKIVDLKYPYLIGSIKNT